MAGLSAFRNQATILYRAVAKVMAEMGIEGVSPRTFKVKTTQVDPTASSPPDRVGRVFDRGCLDAVWISDITYLTCGEGDGYPCAIRDEHSRRVLGWSLADHMRTELVEAAVDAAVFTRGGTVAGTIMHSDRGSHQPRHGPGLFAAWLAALHGSDRDLLGQRRLRIAMVDSQARVLQTPRVHHIRETHCRT